MKHIFKNQIKQEWQKQWNKTNANGNMKIIQPIVSFDMNTWSVDRHHETTLHRLRLGICKHFK